MGRCVSTGIYEPGHPTADADGVRRDVADLTREPGVTTVRYPGGNSVSGYRWEDGVGPRERHPGRRDLAWHSTETDHFGLNEFIRWTRSPGIEPMMAVNLGTRGVQEALDLLEYANHPGGTEPSARRAAHGHPEPHGVRTRCPANEMDGPWRVGHMTAREFAVNRSTDHPLTLDIDLRGLDAERVTECRTLSDDDVYATNTAEDPDRVRPRPNKDTTLSGGRLTAVLPPVSWTVIRLATTAA
jgi:alpha-L-arabinofuranosidase